MASSFLKNISRKLLQGFLFGSGFSIAFVLIYTIWMTWALPKYLDKVNTRSTSTPFTEETDVSEPPQLTTEKRFLGIPAVYAGDFLNQRSGTLSAGQGKIIGKMRANENPVAGVRIRLALNGSVMSQWGVTDSDGQYMISVPYGAYRIDGYELDRQTADQFLPGKIDYPSNPHSGGKFEVGPSNDGDGLHLDYVDPVIKLAPTGTVPLESEIVAEWEPYPGAENYVIQIYENEHRHDFLGQNRIFRWSERPTTKESMINLTSREIPLKADHYYTLEIEAKDKMGNIISQTPRQHNVKDFKVVESK